MAFKSSKRMYYIMAIGGGLTILLLMFFLNGFKMQLGSGLSTFLVVILWVTFSMMLTIKHEHRKHQELVGYFQKECRPDKALPAYEQLLSQRQKEKTRILLKANYSTALLEAGRIDEAEGLLKEIDNLPTNMNGSQTRFIKRNNLFICNLRRGDAERMQYYLDGMRNALQTPEFEKPKNQNLRRMYNAVVMNKIYLMQVRLGNCEGARSYFENQFELSAMPLDRVAVKYVLGQVYQMEGDAEKSQEAYTYVVQNGGTTWYAQQAAQLVPAPVAAAEA